MTVVTRIYHCRCGQFSLVDNTSAICSRCNRREFTHVLWFQPAHMEEGWIQLPVPDDQEQPTSQIDPGPEAERIAIHKLVDEKEPQLYISQARAVLDYLEMIQRGKQISEQQYQEEKRRVIRRVMSLLELRNEE